MAKIGPFQEPELTLPGGLVLLDDLGAGDVRRHQIRRELDATELQLHGTGEGRNQQRLGEARHALEDGVRTGQDAHQHLLDDFFLSDDHFCQLVPQCPVATRSVCLTASLSLMGRLLVSLTNRQIPIR